MRIAIIGAGISGLYLAWKFSEKGHEVTVFEKRNTIGKEACSGLFSERILDFIPQSKKLIQNEINFVLIHFPKKTVRVDFKRKFFVMSHAELDRLVANLAQDSGAEISIMTTGTFPVETTGNVPVVVTRNVLDGFDKVIGCDGANSEVRKYLKLPEPNYRLGILGFVPVRDNSNYVETWPVKNGFIWKIPRGEPARHSPEAKPMAGGEIEYGVIADLSIAKKLLDDFCRKNNLQLQNIKSALIPQGFLIPKNNKITLCGDAAGLTKPWSGGGVIWGMQAAGFLLRNFPDLIKYYKDAKKYFYCKIIFSKLLTRIIYLLGEKFPWILPQNITIDGDKLI